MNYLKKLFSTGAVRETPEKVIAALLREVGKEPLQTIVEIGAGRGELTSALLANNHSFANYFAFEIDSDACAHLRRNFPAITVKNENAFAFASHLPAHQKADLFLSSIPLSFYPHQKINELLREAKGSLKDGGTLVVIFSAFWLIPVLKRQLKKATLYKFLTFPPYFLLVYKTPS